MANVMGGNDDYSAENLPCSNWPNSGESDENHAVDDVILVCANASRFGDLLDIQQYIHHRTAALFPKTPAKALDNILNIQKIQLNKYFITFCFTAQSALCYKSIKLM